MGNISKNVNKSLIADVKEIIAESKSKAVRSVNFYRVQMYWKLGERIFNEEQEKRERAEYGKYLIKKLSKVLVEEYGSGFSERQLERARKFYQLYPIPSAVRTEFNWMQYRLLISIPDEDKREYYELETVKNCWTGRELERQINSQLYERLLLSSDKESVMAIARNERIPESPNEIVKSPMFLEFLGLKPNSSYYEKDLEYALISNLQTFLLELGRGFSFVARQKRITIEDDEFFVDLVFYNRFLRCFVIIELKTEKMNHRDLGQLQMYVNYYDRFEKLPDENQTIGILLCPKRNEGVVELTLPENSTIYAAEYKSYIPDKKLLQDKLNEWISEFDEVREAAARYVVRAQ